MAISIPIISTFSAKGIKQAKAEFAKLETVGEKVGFVLGKAAMGATAAFAGLAAGAVAVGGFLFQAAKAADADRKSQIDLAKTAERFAKANKAQVAGLEATVEQLMLATGIADDDLRPSLGRLIRSFKNTDKASRAMKIALDISGRTGKDLESVVEAMGKAADGSNTALLRLGTGLSKADLKGKSLDEVMALLETRFKGGAADAANTFEGRLERLRVRFGEIVERIGYKVLPYFESFADVVIRVTDAIGKSGLQGGMDELKDTFARMQFEGSPMARFYESMYEAVRNVYNAVQMLKDATKLIQLAMPNQWGRILNQTIRGNNPFPQGNRMPSWEEMLRTAPVNQGGSAANFRMREMGANVTINVNTSDPRAAVRALQEATRRQGSIGGVRYR